LRWKVHGQDEDGKMVLRNVVLEDSNFRSMTWLPAEVILKNTTASSQTFACSGDKCEIVDLTT
jgi:hypothetical protein